MAVQESVRKAEDLFRCQGGLLRTSKALELGVHLINGGDEQPWLIRVAKNLPEMGILRRG